jgi:phosphoadenosine phosphosulfate reductase|tara:strand:+ start:337 stop:1029 length:693 start_codon:yes stop_codon:yes gene_type:complete
MCIFVIAQGIYNVSLLNEAELQAINAKLKDASAEDIIQWALDLKRKTLVTTNFRPLEGVILHCINKLDSNVPVICIDHGYNTEKTYQVGAAISKALQLDVYYYTPKVTAARRAATLGGVPSIEDAAAHDVFTEEVKLEPFSRAMAEFQPEVWFTAIRAEQTAFRADMEAISQDSRTGVIKVAPFLSWTELDMEEYLYNNDLDFEEGYDDAGYSDPTKALANRECGLHTGK